MDQVVTNSQNPAICHRLLFYVLPAYCSVYIALAICSRLFDFRASAATSLATQSLLLRCWEGLLDHGLFILRRIHDAITRVLVAQAAKPITLGSFKDRGPIEMTDFDASQSTNGIVTMNDQNTQLAPHEDPSAEKDYQTNNDENQAKRVDEYVELGKSNILADFLSRPPKPISSFSIPCLAPFDLSHLPLEVIEIIIDSTLPLRSSLNYKLFHRLLLRNQGTSVFRGIANNPEKPYFTLFHICDLWNLPKIAFCYFWYLLEAHKIAFVFNASNLFSYFWSCDNSRDLPPQRLIMFKMLKWFLTPAGWFQFLCGRLNKYVVICLHRPVLNLHVASSSTRPNQYPRLYHFPTEEILGWYSFNIATPRIQRLHPDVRNDILTHMAIKNNDVTYGIDDLLFEPFMSIPLYPQWKNHPYHAEVLIFLEAHLDLHYYDEQGRRSLLYADPDSSDDDERFDEPWMLHNSSDYDKNAEDHSS